MTQEQKDLLLKDLCGRLVYKVKIHILSWNEDTMEYEDKIDEVYSINKDGYVRTANEDYEFETEDIKPYLFPLSSMTEEQKTSHNFLKHSAYANPIKLVDWYNKNHFDYRGLIPMGLAIDATGLNIY